jgi:cytochrome c oxidase accessory protein FixG
MFDPDTLIISYDVARGEPRGARARTADYRAKGFGDCVDCSICVQVCPTGIDIRNGLQLECIGCGGCVDACNQVMAKMGYPAGLVRYTTDNALRQGLPAAAIARRVARPRTLIYSAILLAIVTATAISLSLRKPLKANVLRDRGNVGTGSASAENVYRLKLMNTQEQAADVTFVVRGLPGVEYAAEGQPIRLSPLGERVVPVRVKAPVGDRHGPAVIEFDIRARSDDGRQIELLESARFVFP